MEENKPENPDQVDALFSNKSKSPKAAVTAVPFAGDIDSILYNTNNNEQGYAIIFNHYQFDDSKMGAREGTHKDCTDLENILTHYGFRVKTFTDLKYGSIYDTINNVAREDHSNFDCLVVVVLSHGDTGQLYAKDTTYKPETLWIPFSGENCPTLAGKPKIFLIQACRGENTDDGIKLVRAAIQKDAGVVTHTIPAMADILVMYSSFEGYYSFRSPAEGSWFIQSICKELRERAHDNFDFVQILTFVNKRIAFNYQSNVPYNRDFDRKKQIGTIVSSLTKLFYLRTKNRLM